MADILTRVDRFGDWYAKREDLAGYTGDGAPSGAKVRQYVGMIANSDPSATLMVGCSADSAMQVYVSPCRCDARAYGYSRRSEKKGPIRCHGIRDCHGGGGRGSVTGIPKCVSRAMPRNCR